MVLRGKWMIEGGMSLISFSRENQTIPLPRSRCSKEFIHARSVRLYAPRLTFSMQRIQRHTPHVIFVVCAERLACACAWKLINPAQYSYIYKYIQYNLTCGWGLHLTLNCSMTRENICFTYAYVYISLSVMCVRVYCIYLVQFDRP